MISILKRENAAMSRMKELLIDKYEPKVTELAQSTGYDYDYLWELWMDTLMDPTDTGSEEKKWSYFKGVTLEFDW